MSILSKIKNICQGALIAYVLGAILPASAEPPMWVIEDADSTVYLFGTVHMLKPDMEWFTERVETALARSDEVWLEIPMLESREAMEAQLAPIFMRAALSPGRPLSSRLNAAEQEQLANAVSWTAHPQQLGAVLENMKPWFAITQLGSGLMRASGYDPDSGIDVILSRLAHEKGIPVRGFETLEQQMSYLSHGTDEEQSTALRTVLSTPEATARLENRVAQMAFSHWIDGDPELVGMLMAVWRDRTYPQQAPMSYDVMLKNRNANWTKQIEDLLAGNGVTFIAVGAGHLVGPDNVRDMLAARGIEAREF